MEYAIVDIETTGGYASGSGITEIAILIHDGKTIIDRYQTLINPLMPIPFYIQALTGITDDMVCQSPVFGQIAEHIYKVLEGRVFVAHNVNFDYSFIKHHLERAGYTFNAQKLCTVRLTRKIKPGLSSYSLGKLCDALKIPLIDRHRAEGDAQATAILFSRLLEWDTEGHITTMLGRKSKEQQLPPNLPHQDFEKLPHCAGVYYFKDQMGKVVYVGKAKDIRKRVSSHFTGHNPKPQRQHFLRSIYSVQYEPCGTELIALLLEAVEIKRLWPAFNKAIKRQEPKFALYSYEDQNGYLHLEVGNHRKGLDNIHMFNLKTEAINLLFKMIHDFELRPDLCGFKSTPENGLTIKNTEIKYLPPTEYNIKVQNAIKHLYLTMHSFIILDKGRNENEQSCIWVENGCSYGFGYIEQYSDIKSVTDAKESIKQYPASNYIMHLIFNYAERFPEKVLT
jgi:DNA polymerase-3 subunit epsilon